MTKSSLVILLAATSATAQEIQRAEVERLVERTKECDEGSDAAYTSILGMGEGVLPILDEIGRSTGKEAHWAYRAMAKFGIKALPYVRRLLEEKDPALRRTGALVLLHERITEGCPLVFEAYRRETDPDLREIYFGAAFDVLALTGADPTESHLEFLRYALQHANGVELDSALWWGIEARLPETRAAANRAVESENSEIRWRAVRALAKVGVGEDRPELRRLAKNDPSLIVQSCALFALGKLGDSRGPRELALRVKRGSGETATWACRYLGLLGSKEWAPNLRKALADGRTEKKVVLQALEDCSGVRFLQYPGADLERNVLAWLKALDDRKLRAQLAKPGGPREVAERVLGRIANEKLSSVEPFATLVVAGEKIIPQLRVALRHEKSRVRLVAARLLGDWGDRKAIPLLLDLVEMDSASALFGSGLWTSSPISEGWTAFDVAQSVCNDLREITGHRVSPFMGGEWLPVEVADMDPSERRAWMAKKWKAWFKSHPEALEERSEK